MLRPKRLLPAALSLLFLTAFSSCELFTPITGSGSKPPGASNSNNDNRGNDNSGNDNYLPSSSAERRLRDEVTAYARQFIGAKYQAAGKNPSTGFDCSGFTSFVLGKFNISLSPSSRDQESQGRPVAPEETQPGDLIFFRRTADGPVFHVSLVVENNQEGVFVIHSVSRGVQRENLSQSKYWRGMYASARDVISGGNRRR